MKLSLIQKILQFSVITKATAYKKGSLIILSTPLSIGFVKIFKSLFKDVTMYELVLPIISVVSCLMLYTIFWAVDFVSGMIASKHKKKNNPDWVESEKLYSTLGKIGGIYLLNTLFLVILLFITIIDFQKTAIALLVLFVLIDILSTLFEFQSIGENIQIRYGKKPKYFHFFDRLTDVLEDVILNRLRKLFGSSASPSVDNIKVKHEEIYPEDKEVRR